MFRSGADGPLDYERLLLNTLQGVRKAPRESASNRDEIEFQLWKVTRESYLNKPALFSESATHLQRMVEYDRNLQARSTSFEEQTTATKKPEDFPEHSQVVQLLGQLTGLFWDSKRGRKKTEWIDAISALHHRRFVWGEQEGVKDVRALLKRLEWPHLFDTEHCHLSGVSIDADNVVEDPTRNVGLREELPRLRIHPVLGRRVAELRYKRRLTCSVTGIRYDGNVDFLNPHAGVPFDLLPISPHFVRELHVEDTTFKTFGIGLDEWVANFRSPRMTYVGLGRVD